MACPMGRTSPREPIAHGTGCPHQTGLWWLHHPQCSVRCGGQWQHCQHAWGQEASLPGSVSLGLPSWSHRNETSLVTIMTGVCSPHGLKCTGSQDSPKDVKSPPWQEEIGIFHFITWQFQVLVKIVIISEDMGQRYSGRIWSFLL